MIAVNPPRSGGPFRAAPLKGGGLPVDALRATDRGHPLLYGVATARVAVMQTAVVEAEGTLEPVWTGPHGPVLLAGQAGGQRVVVLAFSPETSEQLPLLKSYPLLIGNAVYWSAEQELESARGMNRRTGDVVALRGSRLRWRAAADEGESGSAALLSARETVLPVAAEDPGNEGAGAGEGRLPLRGDLAPPLLWSVLALLVTESWLFHRHLIY